MRTHRFTFCLPLITLLLAGCGAGSGPQESDADRVWRVGVERQLPPVAFADGSRVRGLAVEMIEVVANAQGHQIELRTADTAELRRLLEVGEIDVIPHMPVSSALESRFHLTLPYWETEDAFFVNQRAGAPPCPLRSPEHAPLGRLIVLEDDPSLEWAATEAFETLPRASVLEALFSLEAGEAGCAALPKQSASILIERLGYDAIQPLRRRVKEYDRSLAFAVRQDDGELQEILEEGLIIATATDQYAGIYNRWDGWRSDVEWPRWLAWALAPLGLLLVWTWSLRRTVAKRTEELQAEMLERQRLEARVQQTRKMESLGVLAGGIAHDFNNLLMGVLGNASLAMHQVPEDSPVRQRLDEIRVAGRRAAELCGQMLAYSGKGRFVLEPIDLGGFLGKKREALEALLGADARLLIHIDQGLPKLRGDGAQLLQMLSQLVLNASEALEDKPGTVSVRARAESVTEAFENPHLGEICRPGDYLILEITDDGVGMDASTKARVFEPFFSTKFTGRGLGLAAVLGIVRSHSGHIDVASEPGNGTTVMILLPALAAPEEGDEAMSAQDAPPAAAVRGAVPSTAATSAAPRLDEVGAPVEEMAVHVQEG
ncbi:MAG: ATP-binding protein [Acidobacteriota bacterium]